MKFIVSSSILYKELQILGGVINSSNTIPILDNFLFELDNNKLKISSSDLESTMTSEIDIESQSTDKVAISAKLLTDILKTFSDQPLTFIKTENNTIEISASNGKYSLAYLEGGEFPKQIEILDAHETLINGADLGNAINSTIFASKNLCTLRKNVNSPSSNSSACTSKFLFNCSHSVRSRFNRIFPVRNNLVVTL